MSSINTVYTTSSLINLHPSEPSVCIPRLFMNIQKERVYDVFANLFGCNAIERVDMIERKNEAGEEYKRAFVHFKYWPRTEQAAEVRIKLLNGDEVKIMYDQPWFWRVSASRVQRPEDVRREPRETRISTPFIVIDEETNDTRRPRYQHRQQEQQQRSREHYEPRNLRVRYEPRYETRDHRDRRYACAQQPRPQAHPRLESRVLPIINVTPTKHEPEISDWIEKSKKVQGAPMKGKKPRLVIADDEYTGGKDGDVAKSGNVGAL